MYLPKAAIAHPTSTLNPHLVSIIIKPLNSTSLISPTHQHTNSISHLQSGELTQSISLLFMILGMHICLLITNKYFFHIYPITLLYIHQVRTIIHILHTNRTVINLLIHNNNNHNMQSSCKMYKVLDQTILLLEVNLCNSTKVTELK